MPGKMTHNLCSTVYILYTLSVFTGIGYKTREKLKALGLVSVRDLQLYPLPDLVKEFGEVTAKRIQNLACGIDDSPVTPAGPPQVLSIFIDCSGEP